VKLRPSATTRHKDASDEYETVQSNYTQAIDRRAAEDKQQRNRRKRAHAG